uniref:Uncharacterized protein n=1 Tax=Steinernema glaseri TaxID=37863 RepID=A0A1I7YL85_9BILA
MSSKFRETVDWLVVDVVCLPESRSPVIVAFLTHGGRECENNFVWRGRKPMTMDWKEVEGDFRERFESEIAMTSFFLSPGRPGLREKELRLG